MKKMVEPTFCLLKTRNCVRNHLKKHDLGGLQRGDLVAGSEDLVHCTVAYEIKWPMDSLHDLCDKQLN